MVDQFNIERTAADGALEPVTLAEAKSYAGIDYDDFDGLIETLIASERETVEDYCALALVQSTVSFNVETTQCKEAFKLPYATKVSNISVKDENDQAVEDFTVWGNIMRIGTPGLYTVSYDVVPVVNNAIKQGIKMLVAYRFNNRGDQEKQSGIPEDIKSKLNPHKILWV